MASSSKKQRTNFSQRSQGTTSMKSNPLDLTKLLANDEQRKIFEEHFHCRTIFTPKISREEIELRMQQSLGETVKNRDILSAGHLKLEDRLLHYLLSYVILPKFSNHSQISDIELQLMYAIKFDIKINWAEMIMRQMWNVRDTQSPLPYAIFITNFLQHFGVSTNGETKVPLNLRESKIDVDVVHKMGFSADPRDRSGRTYLHRSDKKPQPSHQPEPNPAAPQPSEFHAQSSSSAVMPTNQMIMDELVSLRGYITNRMDAFDTQNQQIQYELHCLSSKLRSMEVDEESSEPEKYDTLKEIQKNTLSRRYWFVIIKKGEIVKKIYASDLGTVLMKIPTSPKRRKGRLLMKTKKIKASRQ
ncbi:hypothetical protein Lal_00021384 [Lupinus albus]|nr:hypothetical protein Lal_00021384 [Lupinus albus]